MKNNYFSRYFALFERSSGSNQRKKLPIKGFWNSSVKGTYVRKIHGEIKVGK